MHGLLIQELQKKAECGGAVTSLLKYALEKKMVDAVLAIKKVRMYMMQFLRILPIQRI